MKVSSILHTQLWSFNLKQSTIQRLQVAYNNAMRILLKPRGGRASQMFVTAGVSTFMKRNVQVYTAAGCTYLTTVSLWLSQAPE